MSVFDHGQCIPVEVSPNGHRHEGKRGFWQFASEIDKRGLTGGEAISWLANHTVPPDEARRLLREAQATPRVLVFDDAIQITFDRHFGSYRITQAEEAMP